MKAKQIYNTYSLNTNSAFYAGKIHNTPVIVADNADRLSEYDGTPVNGRMQHHLT